MKISSSLEYAVRLMAALAKPAADRPLSAEHLARCENIPLDFATQILWRLKREAILASRRGASGGFILARPPAEITLAQVAKAVDHAIFEDVCGKYKEASKDCRHQGNCGIMPVWRRLADMVNGYLEKVTVADICAQAEAARMTASAGTNGID